MNTHTELTRFAFVLEPEFPISAVILASEALRIVNQNSGIDRFAWQFVSEEGQMVRASNGMWLQTDCSFEDAIPADVVLLFEGNLPTQHVSRGLLGFLRSAARFGKTVGGIDTGAFALAQAGLAATDGNPEVTLHWEAVPAFVERFPASSPQNCINLSDGNVVHSAGGIASFDLMLDLIARFSDEAMANEVANAMIHSRRPPTDRQRTDHQRAFNSSHLANAMVRLMEQNLDFPLSLDEMADALDTSKRTLARTSEETFQVSPMRLYLRIRLQAARNYLFYEEHSIKDIATACGFSYPAAFSRAFRSQFDVTPSEFRRALRKRQRLSQHPEIHRLIRTNG